MTSGRDALHEIDASIAEARHVLSAASVDAADDARALAVVDKREIDILDAIASIRVEHLSSSTQTDGAIGHIDAKVEKLIDDHDRHVEDVTSALQQAETDLRRLENERRDCETAHIDAIASHEKAAQNTRDRLDKDDVFIRNAGALEQANATVSRARQKLLLAEEDKNKKGVAFENDRLFTYLRDRKFSTNDYSAFFLFAGLDRWVASLIKYRDHKLNYDRLLEIPDRIAEHVERLEENAETLRDTLEAYERKALEDDGVGKLRDKINRLHEQIEALDLQISDAEERYQHLTTSLKDSIAGNAGPLAQARTLLSDAMGDLSIPDLKILAAETETLDDDRMVDSLVRIRRERMELEENKRAVSGTLDRHSRTLSELEEIRRRFKSARFDSPYSEFSGRNIVGALLSEFLRGAVSRDDFWRRIERSHRTRRRDWQNDMGGDPWRDGFGLPQDWGGGDWPVGGWSDKPTKGRLKRHRRPMRIPRRQRNPRPPRIRFPSGGRKGGGGFKTGGGF